MNWSRIVSSPAILKLVETLTSVKFYVLLTTTVLFYLGKITENSWKEMTLIVAGFRTLNEVASIMKASVSKKKAAAK